MAERDSAATARPADAAIVESLGWRDASEGNTRSFTATLVFPSGAPRLTAKHVWQRIPVRVVTVADHEDLIAALRGALAYYDRGDDIRAHPDITFDPRDVERARAALAKAEGRQT